MRREIEITSHIIEDGEETVALSLGSDGISIESNGRRICLTSEQWDVVLDEWATYRRLVENVASAPALPLRSAAE